MPRKRFYDLAAPAGCDAPSAAAQLLMQVDAKALQATDDEGVYRLRITPAQPEDLPKLFRTLAAAFPVAGISPDGLGRDEASLCTQRRGMGEAIVLSSADLLGVVRKLRIGLVNQAETLSL